MYQPTLGRFLSRDPLSETGVDVLTDTGFYSNRLAAMSADPWFYGGNWQHPYVYARNSPVNLVDPSGLDWQWPWYLGFCQSVCDAATKDPKLRGQSLGGVFCLNGIKCVCLFKGPLGGGIDFEPGECPALDACARKHESQHFLDVDCPKTPGIQRPGFRNPKEQIPRECVLRKQDIACITNAGSKIDPCDERCISIAEAWWRLLTDWTKENCDREAPTPTPPTKSPPGS
jgi:hypothetical protein